MGGEVVVKEELAAHEVEGEVVGGPAEEEKAGAVVEAGSGSCLLNFSMSLMRIWNKRRKEYLRSSRLSIPRRWESWSAPMIPAKTARRLLASHQPIGLPKK